MSNELLKGQYQIIETIGRGGMAIVYKAFDVVNNRNVAIKRLKPEFAGNEEVNKRFLMEYKAIRRLNHPGIVNVYDNGVDLGVKFIVMEYIDGITLKEYIEKKGAFGWKQAVSMALMLSDALSHAHDMGVIHRDIKPQNILVGKGNVIKIADFGIARAELNGTLNPTGNNVMGTVHYISPEQAKGSYTDHRTDIYSLGITLYEMVTGRLPFDGEKAVTIALAHINESVAETSEINPLIPPALNDIIKKAMHKDMGGRYQSADAMHSDLTRCMDDPTGDFVNLMPAVTGDTTSFTPIDDDIQPIIKKDWLRITMLVIPLLIVSIFAYIAGAAVYRNNFVDNLVAIPNVEGLKEEDARKTLNEQTIIMKIRGRINDKDIAEGSIISQEPHGGEMADEESMVYVTISKGPNSIIIPNVMGKSRREAETILQNSGIYEILIKYIVSESDEGIVLGQDIPANIEMSVDSEVMITLTISAELEDGMIIVKKYTGFSMEIAAEHIHNDGLEVGTVIEEFNDDVMAGVVFSQLPMSDDKAEPGSRMDLWISLGTQPNYPKELNIKLPSSEPGRVVKIMIEKYEEGDFISIFNRDYAAADEEAIINLTGKGKVKFRIYIDDEMVSEQEIDFSKKEDD